MRFEGITLAAVQAELADTLVGARIQNIYQPDAGRIRLELYAGAKRHLLIATGPDARLHETEQRSANPPEPPPFCMLLRKHLRNGHVAALEQPDLERILDLVVERGGTSVTLRAELFRPKGNIVVLDGETVLGALHEELGERSFAPGTRYAPPPAQGKRDPRGLPQTDLDEALHMRLDDDVKGALFKTIDGIGPLTAAELAVRAGFSPKAPVDGLTDAQRRALGQAVTSLGEALDAGAFDPHLYRDPDSGEPREATPWPYESLSDLTAESVPTISAAIDRCYPVAAPSPLEREAASLRAILDAERDRVTKALAKVQEDQAKAERYEQDRQIGDLLMAHLGQLHKGMDHVELLDFEGQPREIPLDPSLEPAENAQRYYERYKKRKRGVDKLAQRRRQLAWERDHLEELRLYLEQAETEDDLQDLRAELAEAGYLEATEKGPSPSPASGSSGPRRIPWDGHQIRIGRSGRQNDQLIRNAHPDDLWLHAKDRPGAHVVVKSDRKGDPPDDVLERAAELAAFYSQAREASKVPVSYTFVKHLRKPKGAQPGLVVVSHELGTITVEPRGPVDDIDNASKETKSA